MELSATDAVYLVGAGSNTSEPAAWLTKYLLSWLASDFDCCALETCVVTFLAGGHLRFLRSVIHLHASLVAQKEQWLRLYAAGCNVT